MRYFRLDAGIGLIAGCVLLAPPARANVYDVNGTATSASASAEITTSANALGVALTSTFANPTSASQERRRA